MPLPPKQGLYDPQFERDACGLGFVATLRGKATHGVVTDALAVLANLTHRGAAGSDPATGDGAGILLQIPHELYREERPLPEPGDYAVATCFLPSHPARRRHQEAILEAAVLHHGQRLLGWRDVPVDIDRLGPVARASMPAIRQLFIGRTGPRDTFERVLFTIRKRSGKTASGDAFYITSCSSRTVVYKGLMLAGQLGAVYRDLADRRTASRLALVHSRFSTNTFPTWELAHPFRRIAHNGEINTVSGNSIWMRARESLLRSDFFKEAIEDFTPIVRIGGSDSAALDNVVDFLVASGRSLPHVMMMLIPEAFAGHPGLLDMPPALRAFYAYHGCLVEPWDGPAAVAFTDGQRIGAMLDRNGLRPAKYVITTDGLVVVASEFGVLDLEPSRVVEKGRVKPGQIFLVDVNEGRLIPSDEVKSRAASRRPYQEWLAQHAVDLTQLAAPPTAPDDAKLELDTLHRAFGYTDEELRMLIAPMAETGEEPVGSMGIDIPLAVLSEKPQRLFRYFKQRFAQVTNPPVDPIREAIVMSMVSAVGGEGNLLDETPEQCAMVQLAHPILTDVDIAKVQGSLPPHFAPATLSIVYPVPALSGSEPEQREAAGEALRVALAELGQAAVRAVDSGARILIISDRGISEKHIAIPSLLATASVHHHLIRSGRRMRAGILVETAEAREVSHVALLVGYGASGVNPYLLLESAADLAHRGVLGDVTVDQACAHVVMALKKGLQKTMSKMGISAVASYQGAQIFEAVGVDQHIIDTHFTGTSSRIRGIGLPELAWETLVTHRQAWERNSEGTLPVGGHLHFRVTGEPHLWNPHTVAALQKAVRNYNPESYNDYARRINEQSQTPVTLRGLWDLRPAAPAVPLEDVEPADQIVRRFATGAMSFGSISKEAHETLAIAMNRIGGKSNTGEGGEDAARYKQDPNGDLRRSAIKQVASGRFGVTTEYLVNADELQIKIAQGAKPGEGGQLPGHKVEAMIARVRHSTPGVTLISPPPHHDIYSIEDLAQLIFDLKNVNPRARVSVKLVAEAGVGTVAAGVTKAFADVIVISGHDGGTGASPLSSIHHAGLPWELGLAEAQQVLALNGLRGRVRLQVDGQLKTGRDVAFAALLGAEEFGFATAPLVTLGCIMMRKCHLNTCPVGVATQDPQLRAKFTGQPEHVIHYLFFVAEELRQLMASLGFKTVDDMVGRVDCIAPRREGLSYKASRLDFSELLFQPVAKEGSSLRADVGQHLDLKGALDHRLIAAARPALARRETLALDVRVRNRDRALGSRLSGFIVENYGSAGLADDTIRIRCHGSAGQSFGAFGARGLTLELWGDANDYVGKGLSGAILALRPPADVSFRPEEQVIAGNTVLYGATSGKAFFCGRVGERFAVRNSGAVSVVEGTGDHGCEYMTGGTVVVLGPTGRNFAAGMSGGVAFVLDEDGAFASHCNTEMVSLGRVSDAESEAVRALVAEHVERTGSAKAARLLATWEQTRAQWIHVKPNDVARLEQAAAAKQNEGVHV